MGQKAWSGLAHRDGHVLDQGEGKRKRMDRLARWLQKEVSVAVSGVRLKPSSALLRSGVRDRSKCRRAMSCILPSPNCRLPQTTPATYSFIIIGGDRAVGSSPLCSVSGGWRAHRPTCPGVLVHRPVWSTKSTSPPPVHHQSASPWDPTLFQDRLSSSTRVVLFVSRPLCRCWGRHPCCVSGPAWRRQAMPESGLACLLIHRLKRAMHAETGHDGHIMTHSTDCTVRQGAQGRCASAPQTSQRSTVCTMSSKG